MRVDIPDPQQLSSQIRNFRLSQAQTITRVPSRRLTPPNDLDNISLLQTEVPSDRVVLLNPGQLTLLQSVSLQQSLLLQLAKQDMFRHQLMLSNVDQQIFLQEDLDGTLLLDSSEAFEGGGGRGIDADHDAGVVVAVLDTVNERLRLLDTDRRVGEELDPDRAAVGGRAGFERGVNFKHTLRGVGRETERFALRTSFAVAVTRLELRKRNVVLFFRNLVALSVR
jgi:hypothetical protein